MPYIGALDQGTSSTRFLVFDLMGKVISHAQREHKQILPHPGWVEHNPLEIWKNTQFVISSALRSGKLKPTDLGAIGIANQRETVVAWDRRTGLPLANAIVWQDVRTEEYLREFSAEKKEQITKLTGLTISPYFSASKISWLIEQTPSIQESFNRGSLLVGTIDSWLLWNLTGGVGEGVHSTDVTNASRTQLMNIETCSWDVALLSHFKIPGQVLPEIKSSSEIYGYTSTGGFLGASIPIAGILGDQQAALVGQTCFKKGQSKTTYGTGNFSLINTGGDIVQSEHGLLTTVAYKFGSQATQYALEGSIAVTGSAIQWLRDQLQLIETAPEIESLADQVSDSGGVYFVPAFSGLFAPHWQSDVRGTFLGITRATNKAHIARATLEAICFQTRDILEAMSADTGVPLREMRVDGGITANSLCMQLQADVMGIDVIRPQVLETTALGAAYAAGMGVGIYDDQRSLIENWNEGSRWKPSHESLLFRDGYRNWKQAITAAMAWRA